MKVTSCYVEGSETGLPSRNIVCPVIHLASSTLVLYSTTNSSKKKKGKRLKSHIENLEKRAAVADRLCQDSAQLPEDATPPYDHQFPNQQMGDQNTTIPPALNVGQNRFKASSGSNGSGHSPIPQSSRAMSVNRSDR
jgi:hypothetical protein